MRLIRNLALAALLPLAAVAQDKIIPVEINHTGKDPVGQNIVFHLKEKIRSSQRMTLVQGVETPRMKMVITSVTSGTSKDPEASNPRPRTIATPGWRRCAAPTRCSGTSSCSAPPGRFNARPARRPGRHACRNGG